MTNRETELKALMLLPIWTATHLRTARYWIG
jgi:hypothetical protein